MDSMQKILSSSANLHKSLGIMNEHSSALQTFAQEYPNLQDAYRDATTLQKAGNHLLTMQGINKNILGLQSVLLQNDNWRKTFKLIQDEMDKFHRQEEIRFKGILSEQQRIFQDMIQSAIGIANQQTYLELERTMKIIREYTPQEIIRQYDFLSQITKQSPFVSAVQSQVSKIAKILGTENVFSKIATTPPVLESVFPVAMTSFNFSSELDRLNLQEQQNIVDILEQVDLDADAKIDLPEVVPKATQIECVTFVTATQAFWKNNREWFLGIFATADSAIKSIVSGDLDTNLFTITLFVYYWINLLRGLYLSFANTDNGVNSKK